ncbi:MAG: ECF transporter S component [Clostridia bacterium]|nr:ECF transporter S component [Clostridia bacterium]
MTVIKSKPLREIFKILIPFILIPFSVVIGAIISPERSYLYVSLAVTLLSLLLFISGFDRKQTGTRRMVISAVMTALCVIGRFIPVFKPITAITVITGVYIGGESGFLVGAVSAFISNFFSGQGPWTPFQMLGWGIIGLLSGMLSRPLKKNRWLIVTFGTVMGMLYSFIMDVWTVLWGGGFSAELYLAAIVTAIPHTVIYSVSNMIFLIILAKPFGEKLERIKLKYGI